MPRRVLASTILAALLLLAAAPAHAENEDPIFGLLHPKPSFIGALVRPVVCAKGDCETFVFTFGFEAGYRCFGLGARYGYANGTHYIYPDLRFYWEFMVTKTVTFTPMLEFSPSLLSNDAGSTLELMFRPGIRLGWEPAPGWMLFLEPILFDLSFFTRTSTETGTVSNWSFKARYNGGLGVQMRF